jgi:hypothetical protein
MDSNIGAKRFADLLLAAAQDTYIKKNELSALCVIGIERAIEHTLKVRLLSTDELDRIGDLIDALKDFLDDEVALDERLIKLRTLTELENRKIPSYVSIDGANPLTFEPDESVLWIFNNAYAGRLAGIKISDTEDDAATADYLPPDAIRKNRIGVDVLANETMGDLVITDQNVYFLQSEEQILKIAISQIASTRVYVDGIYVTCKPPDRRKRAFRVNDHWFAANLLGNLMRFVRV